LPCRPVETAPPEFGDRQFELFTFPGIVDRGIQGSLGDAEGLGGDADATAVQRLHRDLETVADIAEKVFGGNAAVFKDEFEGGGGADTHLPFLLAEGKAGRALLDDEGADSVVLLRLLVGSANTT